MRNGQTGKEEQEKKNKNYYKKQKSYFLRKKDIYIAVLFKKLFKLRKQPS